MENNNELKELLKENKKEIVALAPKYVNKERMMSIFLEAANNPKIQACTKISVLKSAKRMAEMGTDRVGAGGVWLIPFGKELTVIPDWRLIIDKARRVGVIKHATAEAVFDGDEFSYERGMNPNLIHKPNMKSNKKKLIAAYCIYTLPDGSKDFDVMTKDEVDAIRARSKAKDSGPWVTDFAEMAKKTVIKRGLKVFEGASPELTKLMDMDNEVTGFSDIAQIEPPIIEPKAIDVEHEEMPVRKVTKEKPSALFSEKKGEEKSPFDDIDDEKKEVIYVCANPTKNPDCKKTIDKIVYDFSMGKYKKSLCRSCQNREK